MCPKNEGSSFPSTRSVADDRGFGRVVAQHTHLNLAGVEAALDQHAPVVTRRLLQRLDQLSVVVRLHHAYRRAKVRGLGE